MILVVVADVFRKAFFDWTDNLSSWVSFICLLQATQEDVSGLQIDSVEDENYLIFAFQYQAFKFLRSMIS